MNAPLDWVATVQLIATIVVAAATVYYAWLTRKLWTATDRNAELTQRMLEAAEKPLCAICGLTHQLALDKTLTLTFEIKNAGRAPVNNIHLVSEWKGFDRDFPERVTFGSEWIGILLPGQSSKHQHSQRIQRVGITVTGRRDDIVEYDFPVYHVGLCLSFQGSSSSEAKKHHILLAEYCFRENRLEVRQSFIENDNEGTKHAYRLLDDVSAVGHGSAPASFLGDGRLEGD